MAKYIATSIFQIMVLGLNRNSVKRFLKCFSAYMEKTYMPEPA